jgi:cytochrome c553
MVMRSLLTWVLGLFSLGILLLQPVFGAEGDIFLLGRRDGRSAEFGLAHENLIWQSYSERYSNRPQAIVIGRDGPEKWPYIHPSTNDQWAGAKEHDFSLQFSYPCSQESPLYFVIGVTGAWEPSEIRVAVNGSALTAVRTPARLVAHQAAFDPGGFFSPGAIVFPLPTGSLHAGENMIRIRLTDGSWLVYDYLALQTSPEVPDHTAMEESWFKANTESLESTALADLEEIVFAVRQPGKDGHWYANFGYYGPDEDRKAYGARGRLCRYNLKSRELTVLLEDVEGAIRDPFLHYDGKKILFSYRRGGTEPYHLYEINIDGTGLRQLTDGEFDDIEPAYLPDGGIVFISSRCRRWVNCWLTQVATIHRCDADGGNIRELSANIEHDNTPWVLPDGRILYQRWEYIDRSQVNYHHLWTMNPDGTGQMVYYGNLHPGIVMIDAKPIPDTDNVVAIFSPGHGIREHDGVVTVVRPDLGPDDPDAVRALNPGHFRDPYPIGSDSVLVARGTSIMAMDMQGHLARVFQLPAELAADGAECHEPRPLRAKPRERLIPARTDWAQTHGAVLLENVYAGRNMDGVAAGEIKDLLVLEALPKPVNYTGGMDPLSLGGTFTLERVVGTVPVERDGSAFFQLPANRSFFFVARDEDGRSIKRMQSFMSVMPGETSSCVGCHEERVRPPANRAIPLASLRAPLEVAAIQGVPDVIDYPRDIQPIWDRHCLECHDVDQRKDGVLMTGDRGPMYSHSYFMLTARYQVADGRNRAESNYPPRAIGDSASPLMDKLLGEHHDVALSEEELQLVRLWINSGAAYPGTYAALGSGQIGGLTENIYDMRSTEWPETRAAQKVIEGTCMSCHETIARHPVDDFGVQPWLTATIPKGDTRFRFSRHILFNYSRPSKSLVLLAPLSEEAGGLGLCANDAEEPVFGSTGDPRYQTLLAGVRRGTRELNEIKRFDMPGFVPPWPYIREMVRYGILPEDHDVAQVVDTYELDRAYWKSLWYRP